MQRAIAAEAALAAAVVAGEVDLTAADSDQEEEQAGAEANDQAPGGEGPRAGVGTRRSAPMRSDEDAAAEVCLACQTVYACLFASTYDIKGECRLYCSPLGVISGCKEACTMQAL